MKISVYLKDPDGFYDGTQDSIEKLRPEGLNDAEWEAIRPLKQETVSEGMRQWVEWGEYVTLEFDLETKSARVVPVDEKE